MSRAGSAPRAPSFAPNAQNLQIVDSTLSVIGGDVHNHHNHHYYYERPTGVWVVLHRIPNFRKIYQDILGKATPGTGMWLVKGDEFCVWLELDGNIRIFWGSGIPGAGKTVLAAIVIARLEALCKASPAPICVCYVFFRYSERGDFTVRNVLETIVKQTLERHPDCLALIEGTYARHIHEDTEPTEVELLGLLGELTSCMAATFYVLDALDEAPHKIQLTVVRALASLNAKLFITSRPLRAVEALFPEAFRLTIAAQDDDIDLHITKEIDQQADLQTLLHQAGPALRDEIASKIKENCGGMFLHASLQVDALSECTSARSVRRMLKEFPPRIEDVYLQTWNRICAQSMDYVTLAKAVLVWVINASRSMTIDELELVIATSPETYKLEVDQVVPGTTLISVCRGLVILEEESNLVRLIHYTAKEPLRQLLHRSHPQPHSLLAAVCVTHLFESGFLDTVLDSEETYKAAIKDDPLLAYASDSWAFHAQRCMDIDDSRERTTRFITGIRAFPALTSFDRAGYFDVLSPLHVVGLFHLPLELLTTIGDSNIRTRLRKQTPLIVAARSGHENLVKLLITMPEIEVNVVGADGFSALMRATRVGHKAIVALLLGRPDIQINLVDLNGWSAVMLAARHGHPEILALLLKRHEVQPNLLNNQGLSALMLASFAGHGDIVALLLARDDVSVNQVSSKRSTALMLAARHGHTGVATLLLAHPEVHVNIRDSQGFTALMLAAQHGHKSIVALLSARDDILRESDHPISEGGRADDGGVATEELGTVVSLMDAQDFQSCPMVQRAMRQLTLDIGYGSDSEF